MQICTETDSDPLAHVHVHVFVEAVPQRGSLINPQGILWRTLIPIWQVRAIEFSDIGCD